MRKDKIRAHCPTCRHLQVFVRARINHPLHLGLSVVTAGLWLVSWMAVCIGRAMRPWRCEHCGCHTPDFTVGPDQDRKSPAPTVRPLHVSPARP
jgi:hypothetical protein